MSSAQQHTGKNNGKISRKFCIFPCAEDQSQLLVNYTDKNQGKILRIDFFVLGKLQIFFRKTLRIQIFFSQTFKKNPDFSQDFL